MAYCLYASFCPWPSLVRNVTFKLSLYLFERHRQQPEDVQYDYSSVLVRKHFLNGKKVSWMLAKCKIQLKQLMSSILLLMSYEKGQCWLKQTMEWRQPVQCLYIGTKDREPPWQTLISFNPKVEYICMSTERKSFKILRFSVHKYPSSAWFITLWLSLVLQ